MKKIVIPILVTLTLLCVLGTNPLMAGVTGPMEAPVGQQGFSYLQIESPVADTIPSASKPVGDGTIAAGGDELTVHIQTAPSVVPLDHYLAYISSADPDSVVNVRPDGSFQFFSIADINQALLTGTPPAGIIPWRASQSVAIDETPFVNVPSATLGAGTYTIYFVSTLPGSLSNFYSWLHEMTIGVPLFITLSGGGEVPAVTTTATATANLAVNFTTGAIFGTIDFSGLTSNSVASHIHLGAAGTNGGIILPLVGGAGGTSGTWTVPPGSVLTHDQLIALRNNQLYVNIHSANFTGGEIRGQLIFPDINIRETLTGAQEVPVVATSASGIADFSVNVNSGEIRGTVTFSGLSSSSTASHIHLGAAGTNGGIIIPLAGGAGATSGIWSLPAGTILTPAQLTALINNQLYVNAHSANFTGGEIRSQLYYPRGAPALTNPVTVNVSIGNFFFAPQTITINVGDTVRWTDNGVHSTTSGTSGIPDGKWDSGILSTGQTFSFTFTQAGTYPYFCTVHFFTGTVIVH